MGYTIPKGRGAGPRIKYDEELGEMIDKISINGYIAYGSISQLARTYKCSRTTVRQRLHQKGLTLLTLRSRVPFDG